MLFEGLSNRLDHAVVQKGVGWLFDHLGEPVCEVGLVRHQKGTLVVEKLGNFLKKLDTLGSYVFVLRVETTLDCAED